MPDLVCRVDDGPMLANSSLGFSVECLVISEDGIWPFSCIVEVPLNCLGDTAESINAAILAGAKTYAETQLDPLAVFEPGDNFRLVGGII